MVGESIHRPFAVLLSGTAVRPSRMNSPPSRDVDLAGGQLEEGSVHRRVEVVQGADEIHEARSDDAIERARSLGDGERIDRAVREGRDQVVGVEQVRIRVMQIDPADIRHRLPGPVLIDLALESAFDPEVVRYRC